MLGLSGIDRDDLWFYLCKMVPAGLKTRMNPDFYFLWCEFWKHLFSPSCCHLDLILEISTVTGFVLESMLLQEVIS